MAKSLIILLLIIPFLFSRVCAQQNLVPNPSFEDTIACPTSVNEVFNSTGWTSYGQSSDFFNECDLTNTVGVPINILGYQPAFDGMAYCGLYAYSGGANQREYIETRLTTPMTVGKTYFFSMNVCLSNLPSFSAAANKIGARFSTIPFSYSPPPL
jgi:hypothetical protein